MNLKVKYLKKDGSLAEIYFSNTDFICAQSFHLPDALGSDGNNNIMNPAILSIEKTIG